MTFERTFEVRGEKMLWLAAVIQALRDATTSKAIPPLERDRARTWLIKTAGGIVELLGVDREAWQDFIRQLAADDWPDLFAMKLRT